MFSLYYWDSVEVGKQYHKAKKGWAGNDVKKYKDYIFDLVQKYQPATMLDYGCGRGEQYGIPVPYPTEVSGVYTEPMTFDQFLGVHDIYKFDPCYKKFSKPPALDTKFDGVICSQVLGSIPDYDIPTVIQVLNGHTEKFCFVSLIDPEFDTPKIGKDLYDAEYFKTWRTKKWYCEQFEKYWADKPLYVFFKNKRSYNTNWIEENLEAKTLLKLN